MSTPWSSLVAPVRTLMQGFAQLIYPSVCWVCGNFMAGGEGPVCPKCRPQLLIDPFPTCPRCSSTVGPHAVLRDGCPACRDQSFAFDGVFRMAPYDGCLREVILRMKHQTGEDLTEVIGALWAKQLAERLASLNPDVVVPVPMHWTRRWWRGFDQGAILASCLGQQMGVPCRTRALRQVRRTEQQKQQPSASARLENVRHAFQANSSVNLAGQTVLLVDDVLTSGATANEAARALRAQRPKAVYVVVMAHGK